MDGAPASHERYVWQSRLWRKHALVMALVMTIGVLGFGLAEMAVSYRENRQQIGHVQQARAREVAQALRTALANVERHVGAVTMLPWGTGGWLGLDTRREEYARLLRLVPAVESVSFHDAAGQELLMVSRRLPDRWPANAKAQATLPPGGRPAAASVYGRVDYQDEYDPYLVLDLSYPESPGLGLTKVRLALRALARELEPSLTSDVGDAYAIDASGIVVLHRDASLMLERRSLPGASTRAVSTQAGAVSALGLHGGDVLRSMEALDELRWRVVVEQPLSRAMAPVWATLRRTAAFMLFGLALAGIAAVYLAGRLTKPIRLLHQGVQDLSAGSLDTRVHVNTGDELHTLAEGFNTMADGLQESYAQLENRVAEKTRDLELANRHKSEFLANMSHELRTPLNAIIGFSEALTEQMFGQLNDKQMEYARDIHGSGQHLLSLINDILDLSKIEAGRLEPERSEFDVAAAISNAAILVRERCHRQGVTLATAIDDSVDSWYADERRFKQILVNLLSNAVKFTPSGGRITVQARVADERLEVSVADTGIGIAEADADSIFEPFVQVGQYGTSKGEGTGLGLSLVRRLVELHGGQVRVDSRLGEGARFTFWLPRIAT
jgi:signal transduction histidine kinase